MAAGTFLIYNREPLGWAFAGLSTIIIIASMVAFVRFQNKHRARGILKHGTDPEIIDDLQTTPIAESASETPAIDEEPASVETSNVVEFKPNKQRLNQ